MIVGDSRDKGVMRNGEFVHPILRFGVRFPQGWEVANSDDAVAAQPATAQTLKTVMDRGQLSCGVSQGLPGFSAPDDKGNWTGLDVDLCRAVAAAIFNAASPAAIGGHTIDPKGSKDMDDAFFNIATELRSQYILSYNPSTPRDGKYHEIEIGIKLVSPINGQIKFRRFI